MIKVKAPGKLYIAGEYAVVQPGHKALVMAIDKFISAELVESKTKGSVKSYSNIKMIFSRNKDGIVVDQKDDRFDYIFSAISTVEEFLKAKGYKLSFYDIKVKSELESEDGIKYGLGSSAAVVVAVLKAILEFYRYDYTLMELFKLSCLSSILIKHETSCGDIAAAVFTGILKYSSFSRLEILERYENEKIEDLIASDWDKLSIEKLDINNDLDILIGWTKSPASSVNLVSNSIKNKNKNVVFFDRFLVESDECVEKIYEAYEVSDFDTIKKYISKNRELLIEYANEFGIEIEKEKLEKLIEISENFGLASKTSGAGGGDCGIAITNDKEVHGEIEKEWNKHKIIKLNLNIFEVDNE